MKQIRRAILGAVAITLLACSPSTPGATYLEMHKKVCSKEDLSIMIDYVVPEEAVKASMAITMFEKEPTKKKAMLADMCSAEPKVVSEKVDGDSAVVTFQFGEGGKTETRNFRKIDGKWKFGEKIKDASDGDAKE